MSTRRQRIDLASSVVLIITVVLFIIAAFEKGLTHELLLEAGVFLVSVKLVLSTVHAKIANESIEKKLEALVAALNKEKS